MQYTGSGVYYGEYKKGRRSGAGILQGANGDRIEGTFVSETRQVCVRKKLSYSIIVLVCVKSSLT